MEREHPKRTRRNFTPEFKMEVLSYYYTHGEHRRTTYEKYGISEMNLRQFADVHLKLRVVDFVADNHAAVHVDDLNLALALEALKAERDARRGGVRVVSPSFVLRFFYDEGVSKVLWHPISTFISC